MAHHASAIKRNRQSKKRKAYNKTYKVQIKNATKAVRASKDLVTAEEALRLAAKALDRSAAKGIIHKNTAANRKSSLARFVNKISLAKQAA
jgi:small subunit ribosomal protein S20